MVVLWLDQWFLVTRVPSFHAGSVRSGSREQALTRDRPCGQCRRLLVDGGAQLLLEVDEGRYRGIGGEPTCDLENLPQRPVALLLIERESSAPGTPTDRVVEGSRQELSVAERVADAIAGDGVTVVPRVPDQSPARTKRLTHLVGLPQHPPTRRHTVGVTRRSASSGAERPSSCANASVRDPVRRRICF